MDPTSILGWLTVVERGSATISTLSALIEEGLPPEQITRILERADQRVTNVRNMDLRGTFPKPEQE